MAGMAATKADAARAALGGLDADALDGYLRTHSGLPGPRANLELAQAGADIADETALRRWLAEPDEYLPLCAAICVGRLISEGRDDLWPLLRATADDQRWRVREGVAMGLQRVGDADPQALLAHLPAWLDGSPLVRRAVVAGICEPRLLRTPEVASAALGLVDEVTASLLTETNRRDPDVRVLRQALGYCWSVAVAADPGRGVPLFRRLAEVDDADAQWIVRENRKKKRMPPEA
jgi:hypothetical protein